MASLGPFPPRRLMTPPSKRRKKVMAALTAATPARIPTTAKKSQSTIPMPLSPTAARIATTPKKSQSRIPIPLSPTDPSPATPQRQFVVEHTTPPPTPDSEYCDICSGPCQAMPMAPGRQVQNSLAWSPTQQKRPEIPDEERKFRLKQVVFGK